jgi:hypothetical protein
MGKMNAECAVSWEKTMKHRGGLVSQARQAARHPMSMDRDVSKEVP